jgi:hypothetical protein
MSALDTVCKRPAIEEVKKKGKRTGSSADTSRTLFEDQF